MHPGRVNRGWELSAAVIASDQALIGEQAAAGGYCAVIAMPNTTPTVDTAAVLGSLIERAQREARVPVGFLASITRGLAGAELTEMAELRDLGAIGFTDDGKPVVSAGMLR